MGTMKMPWTHHQNERRLIVLVRDGVLEVDSEGRIWRNAIHRHHRSGVISVIPTQRRRAEVLAGGYLAVYAWRNGVERGAMAHRLVWQHFFGDIPDGLTINHKNGMKHDNRPSNLEVVTASENAKHAYRTGLKSQWGSRNPVAKMTEAQVAEARSRYAAGGITQGQLAREYGVAFQTMSKTLRGENRRSEDGPTDASDHRGNFNPQDPVTGRFLGRQHLDLPWSREGEG